MKNLNIKAANLARKMLIRLQKSAYTLSELDLKKMIVEEFSNGDVTVDFEKEKRN